MIPPELLDQLPGWWAHYLVAFARIGSFLLILPLFGEEAVPPRIRLMAALGMVAALSPLLPRATWPDGGWITLILAEVLIGLALGLLVRMMFLAASMAGAIASSQIGLTAAMAYDPGSGSQMPILARLTGLAALIAACAAGLHHQWIAGVVTSYRTIPLGADFPAGDMLAMATGAATGGLALAISLAAPLIMYGLIAQLVMGLASRLAPAIQIFFIAQPALIAAGLALTAMLFGAMTAAFVNGMSSWHAAIGWG